MHNDAKEFVEQLTAESACKEPSYPVDTAGLLRYFWDRMDPEIKSLPDAELEWLARAADETKMMAGNLSETLGNVAALVGYEVDNGGLCSGGFQPHGLEQLLLHASDTLKTIEQISEISGQAEWSLRDRWKQRALALGFKRAGDEGNGNG
ncbi:hypothetical protein [Burkholderia sp. Ac-20353]|uniref:hypothetical protein n=1 Tax=Burkholderia sp. Ac-20353 TaxID=2703894 RepID=UPI00197C6E30|nr:hypothetical protein [Burkholderia sp. Ac-20353]MBN3788315.1 hypothetical protein [Burkholderia sp. Ac-20353]